MSFMKKMFSKTIETKATEEIVKRPSLLKLISATPDDFKLEAWVEENELRIVVKKKDISKEEN